MRYEDGETRPFCGGVPILASGPVGRGKSLESQQFRHLGGCNEK